MPRLTSSALSPASEDGLTRDSRPLGGTQRFGPRQTALGGSKFAQSHGGLVPRVGRLRRWRWGLAGGLLYDLEGERVCIPGALLSCSGMYHAESLRRGG